MTKVEARPEAIAIDPRHSAVIVVDMQNGFVSEGGYLHRAGFDIAEARSIVANCRRVIDKARENRIPVIYLQMGWHSDLHDAGRPKGGMWHKSVALRLARKSGGMPTALIRGSWDFGVVDELTPQVGDIVVVKTRLSGFYDTNLDSVLRSMQVESLVFVGTSANICVEATIRDALYRDYICLLVEDATNATGPEYMKKATVFNIEHVLGWVTTTEGFCKAFRKQ